jgi:hypothetical protein
MAASSFDIAILSPMAMSKDEGDDGFCTVDCGQRFFCLGNGKDI